MMPYLSLECICLWIFVLALFCTCNCTSSCCKTWSGSTRAARFKYCVYLYLYCICICFCICICIFCVYASVLQPTVEPEVEQLVLADLSLACREQPTTNYCFQLVLPSTATSASNGTNYCFQAAAFAILLLPSIIGTGLATCKASIFLYQGTRKCYIRVIGTSLATHKRSIF